MPQSKRRENKLSRVKKTPTQSDKLGRPNRQVTLVLTVLLVIAVGVLLTVNRRYIFSLVALTLTHPSTQATIHGHPPSPAPSGDEQKVAAGKTGGVTAEVRDVPLADSPSPTDVHRNLMRTRTTTAQPNNACATLRDMPSPPSLPVAPASFESWRKAFADYARVVGIGEATIQEMLNNAKPVQKVLTLDRHQSEYTRTFFDYLTANVSLARLNRGRALMKQHHDLLASIERRKGVPASLLVALWGIESDFGSQIGNLPVIASLATLAHDGRRPEFFTVELLDALRIIQSGGVKASQMKGSWAGAMGQPQFMPSTYCRHAEDGDGDGRADIWTSVPDVLESTASYLADSGWSRGQPWGMEVLLPRDFAYSQARLNSRKPLREWQRLRVTDTTGKPLPTSDDKASIILPAGYLGPAFLVYSNFNVIREWNRALYYALTVGYLSDRLNGSSPLVGRPPPGDQALSRNSILALQHGLNRLGFDVGNADGFVGTQTREAVADYQECKGLPADGYPTPELIARIEEENTKLQGQMSIECQCADQHAHNNSGLESADARFGRSNGISITHPEGPYERLPTHPAQDIGQHR